MHYCPKPPPPLTNLDHSSSLYHRFNRKVLGVALASALFFGAVSSDLHASGEPQYKVTVRALTAKEEKALKAAEKAAAKAAATQATQTQQPAVAPTTVAPKSAAAILPKATVPAANVQAPVIPRAPVVNNPNGPYTLSDLVAAAVTSNPAVRGQQYEYSASQSELDGAKQLKWPTLRTSAAIREGGGVTAVGVERAIWDNGKGRAQINRAAALSDAASFGINSSQSDVATRTVNAWEQLAGARLRTEVIDGYLRELNDFQAMMTRRVNAGVSARIELDLVQSRIAQSQVEQRSARTTEDIALSKLSQLTGIENLGRNVVTQMDFDRAAQSMASIEKQLNAANLVTYASSHPSVRKAAMEAVAADETAKLRAADKWPTVVARYGKEFGPGASSANNGLSVGVEYMFGGGATARRDAAAAVSRAEGLRESQEAQRRLVAEVIQTEWQTLLFARDRGEALDIALKGSRMVKESYARQFIAGRKSWLEVLNALREVEANELQLAEARVAALASAYRLKILMGGFEWQQTSK